jgi:hypothetical protein
MNTPPCGAPHHLYPDTLCTEPAGHYRRDRDPHAGPLIVGGRERGGAAWDEPKERRMSDRHTADTITDDALDALYEQLDARDAALATYTAQLQRDQAALDRVRSLADRLDEFAENALKTSDRELYTAIAYDIRDRATLAATEATSHVYLSTGCLHGHHDYCQNHTGHSGTKTPAQCKFCSAPCTCHCHQHHTTQPADQPKEQPMQHEKPAPTDWKTLAEQNERRWKDEGNRRAAAEAERDRAYRERARLVALVAGGLAEQVVVAPASDVDEPGWQILYATLHGRQCSWHFSPQDADLIEHFDHVPADDPRAQWDGHTTEAKYQHIDYLARALGTPGPFRDR